ncbi:SDR family oxidoreductase [Sulfuricurvum sp.]|uniref:SDR family oxidoreductase n=1 Tax=Sulfuricurvum sp. TaxID=2025608 RepID=UPI00286D7881|nr:SDR family NAD(P)-dependent oxidoreductase [Sulfuricurvum sp.]
MHMTNNTILITGGTSGIGYELARQLCEKNTVIITGRNSEKLEKVKKELKNIHIFKSDVADPQEITALYEMVSKSFPHLNILINNAGISKKINMHDENDFIHLTQEINTNLSGVIYMCNQFLPLLKRQKTAAIVNVSSALAFVPFSSIPVYSATKAALHSFTKSLRIQLKNSHVKVIELMPAITETPLLDEFEQSEKDKMVVMPVSQLAKIAIKKMGSGTLEIRPGQSNALKMMSRIAPNFALNMINK